MVRRFLKVFLIVSGILAGSNVRVYAWFNPTHMAIGVFAYNELESNDPQSLKKILVLLKKHPYYQSRWEPQFAKLQLSSEEKDKYLFMLAARWPDDVKGNNVYYDHPGWHFINNVYAPPKPGLDLKETTQPLKETILTAFDKNSQTIRSNVADSTKAIALCWLFHLAGDVHMPLHAATLVNPQFPQGDRGGNIFKIKVTSGSPTINLHALWDGVLLNSDDYQSVEQLAIQMRNDFPRSTLWQLGSLSIEFWAKESFQLAQDNAYRSNTLLAGSGDDGALIPTDYMATIKPIAERQATLAGYRLADKLAALFVN